MTTFKPGDRILWAARNGTVRHGRIVSWAAETSTWFVEIDHDPVFGRRPNGFRTWFKPVDLIPEVTR